jgi:hypothetical protein
MLSHLGMSRAEIIVESIKEGLTVFFNAFDSFITLVEIRIIARQLI